MKNETTLQLLLSLNLTRVSNIMASDSGKDCYGDL